MTPVRRFPAAQARSFCDLGCLDDSLLRGAILCQSAADAKKRKKLSEIAVLPKIIIDNTRDSCYND